MRDISIYLCVAVVCFFLGVSCSFNRATPTPEKVETLRPEVKKLPKEVQEQFDSYILTSAIVDELVVRIVKRVVQTVFIATLVSILFDFPLHSAFIIISAITLVSYPLCRYLISREIRTGTRRPDPKVLSD